MPSNGEHDKRFYILGERGEFSLYVSIAIIIVILCFSAFEAILDIEVINMIVNAHGDKELSSNLIDMNVTNMCVLHGSTNGIKAGDKHLILCVVHQESGMDICNYLNKNQ